MSRRDDFEGFAAPKEYGIPHFRVEIPSSLEAPITIIEDFGFAEERSSEEKRAVLPRKIWSENCQGGRLRLQCQDQGAQPAYRQMVDWNGESRTAAR